MTPEPLIREWLSLRALLMRCVLPSAVILLALLLLARWALGAGSSLNHNAVIIGFFITYFILFRGGHMVMMRTLHFELMRKYEVSYRELLGYVPIGQVKRYNLGFTLARIKRDCIVRAQAAKTGARQNYQG